MSNLITRQYINVTKNFDQNDQMASIFKKFGQNIVNKANEFDLSVDRFRIMCDGIPIFIFDPSTDAYTVELKYKTFTSGPIGVQYVPHSTLSPGHPKYYYIYTFEAFIQMINTAIETAFTTLGGMVSLPAGSVAPWFELDMTTKTLSVVAQQLNYESDIAEPISLSINKLLYTYLGGFFVDYDTNAPFTSQTSVTFLFYDQHNNTYTDSTNGVMIRMSSELGADALIAWNISRGIAIVTTMIPINQEVMPSPNTLLNNMGILANFDFFFNANEIRPVVAQYATVGPPKLINLNSNAPVDTIDLKIYWYDGNGNMFPLDVNLNKSCSIRLVFIRKGTQ